MHTVDWSKYFYVFLITLAIFATAFYTSYKLNNKKLDDIQTMQNRVSIDVLSSETQFSLLAESSCESIGDASLSQDLDALGAKLSYAEKNITSKTELLWLKKNYALLEIKDYILTKKIAASCDKKPAYVLYFYSNEPGECPDCKREGMVLTELRRKYPGLRVYSFDYNLDLAAQKTLLSLFKVKDELPAIVVNGRVYHGFQGVEDIEKLIPNLKELLPKETATTTEKTLK